DTAHAIFPGTLTDSTGSYAFNINAATMSPSGPICIVATGGVQIDEATGSTIDMGTNSVTTLVPSFKDLDSPISITALTNIASNYVQTQLAQNGKAALGGLSLSAYVANANYM